MKPTQTVHYYHKLAGKLIRITKFILRDTGNKSKNFSSRVNA